MKNVIKKFTKFVMALVLIWFIASFIDVVLNNSMPGDSISSWNLFGFLVKFANTLK